MASNISFFLSPLMSICIVLAVLAGCAGLKGSVPKDKQRPSDDAARTEIQALLAALDSRNAGLVNFKGVGKIKVRQKGKLKINEQIAWIGSEKNQTQPGRINRRASGSEDGQ